MNKNLFNYNLPPELIAQSPSLKRDESRLYFLDRKKQVQEDLKFKDIKNIIKKDMVLVLNETKVVSARFFALKEVTNAKIEIFYLSHNKDEMTALVKPARRVKEGVKLIVDNDFYLIAKKNLDDGIVLFKTNLSDNKLIEKLEKIGEVPLPPYIKEKIDDKKRYQTVYAKEGESVAAPTAGLHFTEELLEKIKEKGVIIAEVFLDVGLGTFRPVQTENILEHKMHSEKYKVPEETVKIVNDAKKKGNRVIAVGTTSVRTLESSVDEDGKLISGESETSIFIYGDYKFKVVDAIITNFHLPKSTLIMLISAFGGKETVFNAYHEAIREKYRFYSFGDSMFIY